jgi:hypothetical protein
LRVGLAVESQREASRIGELLRNPLAASAQGRLGPLSTRAESVIPRIAHWLRQHDACEIPAQQAEELLRLQTVLPPASR